MIKLILAIFLCGVLAGLYVFSSDSSKESVKKAGTELVRDARDNAKEAALEKAEETGTKVVARVKDIKQNGKEKVMKK